MKTISISEAESIVMEALWKKHPLSAEEVFAAVLDQQEWQEATVKTFARQGSRIILTPANATMAPMDFDPSDVTIYGKVVTVLRKL